MPTLFYLEGIEEVMLPTQDSLVATDLKRNSILGNDRVREFKFSTELLKIEKDIDLREISIHEHRQLLAKHSTKGKNTNVEKSDLVKNHLRTYIDALDSVKACFSTGGCASKFGISKDMFSMMTRMINGFNSIYESADNLLSGLNFQLQN